MKTSAIRRKFETAYVATDYRVLLPRRPLTFRVGHHDPASEAELSRHCGIERDWAIITPCNPGSEASDHDANLAALARLRRDLGTVGLRHFNAINQSPEGEWPELGYLIADIDLAQAKALGRRYRQHAFVAARLGEAPRLEWLV